MLGDNKPTITDLLTHVDRIGNLGSELRDFMQSEGKIIVNGWSVIEPTIDAHISSLQEQVKQSEDQTVKAKAALENANNLKSALKDTFADTAKSVSALIGLKVA